MRKRGQIPIVELPVMDFPVLGGQSSQQTEKFMKLQLKRLSLALVNAALISVAGCGGGSDTVDTTATTPAVPLTPLTPVTPVEPVMPVTPTTPVLPVVPPVPTTTNVTTTVIDGAIKNAVVCMDKNSNGQCDADEVQGKTDAAGSVTLAVPNADVGKFPLLALVGTDAVDADNGPVTVAYSMGAPADKTAIISPLTTLVQRTVANTNVSTDEAEKALQSISGINASMFQDFSKAIAPADGSASAATVARMIVVAAQAQSKALAALVGTPASDGKAISQSDMDVAIQNKILQMLPAIAAVSTAASVVAAATPAAKEAAALAVVNGSLLTAAALPAVVAVNTQIASATGTAETPAAGFLFTNLTFTDLQNWFMRAFTTSTAQSAPDASNNYRLVERRARANAGNVANWNSGGDPARQADVHWTGSAWANCALNFEFISSLRDAKGNSAGNYCDNFNVTKSKRTLVDIAGKTLKDVYDQTRAAGYTNLNIANTAALGTATFPAGSALYYTFVTDLAQAVAYNPGSSSDVLGYSAAVAAGGDTRTSSSPACTTSEASAGPTKAVGSLEDMVALNKGTPCIYNQSSLVSNGVTYSGDVQSEWWGQSTLSIGTVGGISASSTPTGFYTGNALIRLSFAGSGLNPVTYYACKERFINFSQRNCTAIGTGTYSITTLGDARVMTLSNPPAQAAPLTYTRTFVERGGKVYFGYQSKLLGNNAIRLNATAGNALLAQLGLPVIDPNVAMALTAASYQGTWDVRDSVATTGGTTLFVNANGTSSCQDRASFANAACTVTVTNPATGAFTVTSATGTASGTFNFLAGTATGTYNFTSPTVLSGTLVGQRR